MFKKLFIFLAILTVVVVTVPIMNIVAQTNDVNGDVLSSEKLKNAIVLYVGSNKAVKNGTETSIEGSDVTVVPYIKNGRTLVPVRFISEVLGAKVDWKPAISTVLVEIGGKKIELVIGSNKIKIDGKAQEMESSAEISRDRTFIPLRVLAEAVGKKVFYDRGLIIISNDEKIFDVKNSKLVLDNIISKVNVLPSIDSVANLKKLLEKTNTSQGYAGGLARTFSAEKSMVALDSAAPGLQANVNAMAPQAAAPAMNEAKSGVSSSEAGKNADFSKTNVQVEGVDEADIVKTDGEYIYQVNNGEIIISKAYPANSLEVTSRIKFSDNNYEGISPVEMYVDNNQLTVIVTSSRMFKPATGGPVIEENMRLNEETEGVAPESAKMSGVRMMPPYQQGIYRQFTNVYVYDISNKVKPEIIKDFSVEGNYVSSRKINSNLYVISNKYINIYPILYSTMNTMKKETTTAETNTDNNLLPQEFSMMYHDSAVSTEFIQKPLNEICYFPNFMQPNYLIIAGADLSKPKDSVYISTYLGAGQTVYASTENLYVALEKYDYSTNPDVIEPMVSGGAKPMISRIVPSFRAPVQQQNTLVYKFSMNNGRVTYLSKGEVPGKILNQFSMDESDKYFRIATTTDEQWTSNGQSVSKNNMFVLDDTMNIAGKITDIAPGEKIYSVRFMGKRAYMVTFKRVDPLFVIDLSNPQKPEILGQLKIPGFSDYLHPYDENHIIGFGKDTVEGKNAAYYLGMKMAMFDVTDVTNPKQEFVEMIGDRGTDSELLRNHKALLFSKEKNLLAFPVTIMKVQPQTQNPGDNGFANQDFVSEAPQYGQFEWQGAYVYSIDPDKGFKLRGKITHLSQEDLLKSSTYGFDYEKQINRVLYIGDVLYTLSNKILKASGLGDLNEIKSIEVRAN